MMRMNKCLLVAGMAAALTWGSNQLVAQDNNNNNNNSQDRQGGRQGRGGPGGGGGNFDPAQFQQRMLERYKEQLEVKDDAEWKAIEPLVQKVMDARMASFSGMGRGMFGGRGGRGGGDNNNSGDRGGRGGALGQTNPEADTLQKAIDTKATNSEIKAALAKYVESKKAKQAELEKAQADLRKVLSVRQEAIASLNGLL